MEVIEQIYRNSTVDFVFSLTCFSLATFDPYCATCPYPRLSNAQCLTSIFGSLELLHGIP